MSSPALQLPSRASQTTQAVDEIEDLGAPHGGSARINWSQVARVRVARRQQEREGVETEET